MKDREFTSPPYGRLAEIYDYVMRHVDYRAWADYVEGAFARHGVNPVRVLDLACGTGTMALSLSLRGYEMTGVDASEEMLEVARRKAAAAGRAIPFHAADLRSVEGLPAFDAVLCLYDSMNYMMSPDEMARAFAHIRPLVGPGGIFVFDVCTEANSIRYFRDMTEREAGDGFAYVRRSHYQDGIQTNDFTIRFHDSGESIREIHRQRIYPVRTVVDAFAGTGFDLLGAYDGFTFNTASEESDRVHFVLGPT
jgi:SAM-dependent methyltransferase